MPDTNLKRGLPVVGGRASHNQADPWYTVSCWPASMQTNLAYNFVPGSP